MKILILEDDNERIKQFRANIAPRHTVISTDNVKKAISYLEKFKWDFLFLDHDLGGQIYVDSGKEETGAEVARWLSEHPDRLPNQIFLHSLNESGRKYMNSLIPNARPWPFAWVKVKIQ